MERLASKFIEPKRALASLKKSVLKYNDSMFYDSERLEEYRDALIWRFKYSLDLVWKVTKNYLAEIEGFSETSPKPVFRACLTAKLLSEEETKKFLEMIDARNTTSHVYREEFATILYKHIPAHYRLMQELVDRMAEKIKQEGR